MKTFLTGVAGTLATITLKNVADVAAIAAGFGTAAWMARQLWLSFKPSKK